MSGRTSPAPPADEPIDVEADGRVVRVTHPDRVIWPATGTTKRELIAYLLAVAPVLLNHVRRRATMLWRFPEGVDGPGWFQAQCRSRPPWVETFDLTGKRGDVLRYCVIDEPATLVWLANLGTIELHPHNWTVDRPDVPTQIVFDLDPGPPAGLREAAGVALTIADHLRTAGLDPLVKTSGGLGLHVAARVDEGWTFNRAKTWSRSIAETLAADAPDTVVARSDRRSRPGRVYVDWIQNDRNRQLVAPYSPRATAIPQVSTPMAWDEIRQAAHGDIDLLRPTFRGVIERIGRTGDEWAAGIADTALQLDMPYDRRAAHVVTGTVATKPLGGRPSLRGPEDD
jgi:bifunctional non-homologous end joining protein LigD